MELENCLALWVGQQKQRRRRRRASRLGRPFDQLAAQARAAEPFQLAARAPANPSRASKRMDETRAQLQASQRGQYESACVCRALASDVGSPSLSPAAIRSRRRPGPGPRGPADFRESRGKGVRVLAARPARPASQPAAGRYGQVRPASRSRAALGRARILKRPACLAKRLSQIMGRRAPATPWPLAWRGRGAAAIATDRKGRNYSIKLNRLGAASVRACRREPHQVAWQTAR